MNILIRSFLLFGIALTTVTSLHAQVKSKPKPKPVAKPVAAAAPLKTFDNGIKMKLKGFKVKEAYLQFDDGSRVPADNKVELNERINMIVVIEDGWKIVDEKAFPGGSEVIKLSDGYEVLKSNDLFDAYTETGVNPEDAKYITLKAIMTGLKDKRKYIIVSFRIWDKKGSSEITGSYKFFIK